MHMNSYHLTKIKQHFPNNSLADVKSEVSKELLKLQPLIKPGASIAIAVGSRGIKNIVPVVRRVAEFIMENHANPFISSCHGQPWSRNC